MACQWSFEGVVSFIWVVGWLNRFLRLTTLDIRTLCFYTCTCSCRAVGGPFIPCQKRQGPVFDTKSG